MKVFHALIIEDAPPSIDLIRNELAKLPFFTEPTIAASLPEARSALLNGQYDLMVVNLDIDNTAMLRLFAQTSDGVPKIAMTNQLSHAVTCYELGFTDYLVTPFVSERFMKAVNKSLEVFLRQSAITNHTYVFLKSGRQHIRFALADIDYIEAYGIYTKLYCSNQVSVINESISTLEELLPNRLFLRVHKSYIINIGNITGFSANLLYIKQAKIPIGNSYKGYVENIFRFFYNVHRPIKE